MKATIGHVGLNLSNSKESFRFWKDLLSYLEFTLMDESKNHFDATGGKAYFCIGVTDKAYEAAGFHRKRTGLNHIALQVGSKELVDQFVTDFLVPRNIAAMYGGVREYPEYVPGYYAVFFEDPDRIKIEVVYEPAAS
jgi:catechol 2,3-dioxygenase-like lactoylglutathione lyase family enzyme